MEKRWTIRGVDPEAIALVQEVSARSGETLGALVSEAVQCWYASLPEEGEDPDIAELRQQWADYSELLRQLCHILSGKSGYDAELSEVRS